MTDVIAQKAEAFIIRRSFHEKVWKATDDNKIVYKKVAWRPPDTCNLIRNKVSGELEGFTQWVQYRPEQIPILLPYADVYVHGARRDPVRGISDLTVTYHNYRTKEKIKFLWYTYCELLSMPRQVILATSDPAAKKAATAIASLKNAGVAGIPAEWVKDHWEIQAGGSAASDFQDVLGYLDSDSALSLLAGFTDLPARAMGAGTSHGPQGSYSLAQSSQDFFTDMEESYAQELSNQVTTSLIADLVRYNFGTKAPVPYFSVDLQQEVIGKAFQMLQQIGTSAHSTLPDKFVEELTMIVAKALGMNLDEIRKSYAEKLKQEQQQAATPQQAAQAPLSAATEVGTMVAQEGQRQLNGQVQ